MDSLDLNSLPVGALAFDLETRYMRQAIKVRERLGIPVTKKTAMRDIFHGARDIVTELTHYQIHPKVSQSDATGWWHSVTPTGILLFVSGDRDKHYADALKKLGMILWYHMSTRRRDDEAHARHMADLFVQIVTCPSA